MFYSPELFVGHFSHELFGLTVRTAEGLTSEGHILSYVQEFGLILFVYAIGVQVGPSFFSSLRSMGAKLVGWAVLINFPELFDCFMLAFCRNPFYRRHGRCLLRCRY